LANQQHDGPKSGEGSMGYRRLVQFHENPKIISLWLGLTGPLLRWLTPSRRRLILAIAAVWTGLKRPVRALVKAGAWSEVTPEIISSFLVVAVIFAFFWLCYRTASKFSSLPSFIRSNPQLSLHALFWLLLIVVWNISPEAGIWRIVLVGLAIKLPFFLWRVGYMLLSAKRGKMAGTGFKDHLMYLWPSYGGSNTPYGKGLEYLSRNEAKDEEALARAQLAGIRLLLLCSLWQVVMAVMNGLVFGSDNYVRQALGGFTLDVPHIEELLKQSRSVSPWMAWACLYFELIRDVLRHAIGGHEIIGIVRLAGFYVFRNTYKPLLSETVVEFWNRYYYYFKEIMVEFFFYPTFIGWFRKWPKVRLLAAVYMAAFVGNMYYHLIGKEEKLANADFHGLWVSLHTRLFYCFMLSAGIFISMLREQRRAGQPRTRIFLRRGLSIFGVWTFFAIINIWNQGGSAPFFSVTKFFLGLIGLT
jgi:hypothetical protein